MTAGILNKSEARQQGHFAPARQTKFNMVWQEYKQQVLQIFRKHVCGCQIIFLWQAAGWIVYKEGFEYKFSRKWL